MELSPRAKLNLAHLASILIPGVLTIILGIQHRPAQVWMWAPAGLLTAISSIDYCIANRNRTLFRKVFFGILIAADLYFMTHIDKGKSDNPGMVLAFTLTSLFLSGSFLFSTLRVRSETESPRLNIFTKIGLGIFKVIEGARSKYFWLMSAIYFSGVMAIIKPGNKPPWAWWVGGSTTLMYIIFNLMVMRRSEKEVEARFSRPSFRQELPVPQLRLDPHPGGVDRVAPAQPAERNRTVGIYVDGVRVGAAELTPRRPDPIMEVLPEPEPESRLARVLRDNYPL